MLADLWNLVSTKLGRASAWLVIGGVAAGVMGYVFQVLMGRMLTVQDYGLFNALMAHLVILSAPMGALMMMVTRRVSACRAVGDHGSIRHLYYSTNFRAVFVTGAAVAICFLFLGWVQSYLEVSDSNVIVLMGLVFLSLPPKVINNSFLQGLQYFRWLSIVSVLEIVFKIVCVVILVQIGYGLSGVFSGVFISGVLVWLIIYIVLHRPLIDGQKKQYRTDHFTFRLVLPVLLANTAFVVMTQLDIVIVKYYFTAEEVGFYAAASIMGKAVMYLPGYISLALFPMVAEDHVQGKDSAGLLFQAIGLTVLLCSIGALFYFMFGEWVIALLYGESYRESGEILRYFGFAMFPMALVMVAEHFLIARGRVLFGYIFFFTAPFQILAIHFFHDSLFMILVVVGISGLLHVVVGFSLLLRRDLRRARSA